MHNPVYVYGRRLGMRKVHKYPFGPLLDITSDAVSFIQMTGEWRQGNTIIKAISFQMESLKQTKFG